MNNLKTLLLSAVLLVAVNACKKETVEQEISLELKDIQLSNTTQNSFSISYQLNNNMFSETGLLYATDSLALVKEEQTVTRLKGVEKNGSYLVVARKLSAFTSYWYRIFAVDHKGITRLFKISKAISNGFNLHWPGEFNKMLVQSKDNGIALELLADQPDKNMLSYKATLGANEISLLSVAPVAGTENTYLLNFSVFETQTPGPLPFKLYYKGSLVFESELTYDNSNQLTAKQLSTHPSGYGGNAFFRFKDNVYTTVFDVSAWNPNSNTWALTGQKINEVYGNPALGDEGLEVNGKIWFRPFSSGQGAFIRWYAPESNIWGMVKLMDYVSTNSAQEYIDNATTFVYQGKIYAFLIHGFSSAIAKNNVSESILGEFDPASGSWRQLMVLDHKVTNYKAMVFNEKIYVTATTRRTQLSGSPSDFRSLWYELDLKTPNLIDKSPLVIDGFEWGALKPAMFNYRGHLFMYGGAGYDNYETRNLYEYLPSEDKWKRYFIQNSGILPGQWSFCYVIADHIYIGMGSKNGIYELTFSKPLSQK
ncbi:MAG: hypothetical protein WKF66_07835 [Pedobacter sp.]